MEEITFKYIFEDDYNPQYVNGAFGGVGPQGEIIVHFFCERGAIPKQIKHIPDEHGELSMSNIVIEPDDVKRKYIRFVQSGIIVERKHALEIYEWLGKLLKEKGEDNEE